MRLNGNVQFQGITAAQSSTIGWKEITCARNVGYYQDVETLQLSIAAGNPEIYFTTYQEESIINNDGAGVMSIAWCMGWWCLTNGSIDNPTGYGACNFIPWQYAWNYSGLDWGYWNIGTRYIRWKVRSNGANSVNGFHRVMVYSERIDLITLSCV